MTTVQIHDARQNYEAIWPLNVVEQPNRSLEMVQNAMLGADCSSRSAHVLNDGLPPTDKHYFMNGSAVKCVPEGRI